MNSELDPSLMAYADGQLSAADAAAFEQRLASEPGLQEALTRQRRLQSQLRASFDPVLEEPVPEHLLRLVQAAPDIALAVPPAVPTPPPLAPVLNLARARAQRQAAANADALLAKPAAGGPDWLRWGGLAASLVLGMCIGYFVLQSPAGEARLAQGGAGSLLASGPLAQALNTQLSGESRQGVTPGVSFVAQSGAYCRSFSVAGQGPAAGLACRDPAGWRLQAVMPLPASAAAPELRLASTALPPELLRVVDDLRVGDSLDAAAEKAARERGWRR